MTKNLEHADTVVKLTLAVSVIILFTMGFINGPFAIVLSILSGLTIFIFLVKFLYTRKHPPDQ